MKIMFAEQKQAQTGFTLIELMVVVAIVGIIAAVGYPSYVRYVIKSNRSAAESFMMSVSNREEQYMLDARQYATGATALTTLGLSIPAGVSTNYTIAVAPSLVATPPGYTITATPIGTQLTGDTTCANLTLDQTGAKGVSGAGPVSACW